MESIPECLVGPTPNAVSCQVAGETVILDMPSGRYFALDPVGSCIWQWLQTPSTVTSLCERLLEEYDVAPETCRQDVSNLLENLAGHGLVKFEDAR